jgi:hypothetical protein
MHQQACGVETRLLMYWREIWKPGRGRFVSA